MKAGMWVELKEVECPLPSRSQFFREVLCCAVASNTLPASHWHLVTIY